MQCSYTTPSDSGHLVQLVSNQKDDKQDGIDGCVSIKVESFESYVSECTNEEVRELRLKDELHRRHFLVELNSH